MKLTDRELAAVLAGLRLLQRHVHIEGHNTLPPEIDDIFQNSGTLDALNPVEIDALCERLNSTTDAPTFPQISGYHVHPTGGNCYAYRRVLADGTYILISDDNAGVEGDPGRPIWFVSRNNQEDGVVGFSGLTLVEALTAANSLRAPVSDEQVWLGQTEGDGCLSS